MDSVGEMRHNHPNLYKYIIQKYDKKYLNSNFRSKILYNLA